VNIFRDKYGPWALIVGAAEGLGEAFCLALANKKMNLVMVDNRKAELESLSIRLQDNYGILTQTLHLELNNKSATAIILESIKSRDIGLLIYNAAFSRIKPFIKYSAEELDAFISVNADTQIHLIHAMAKRFISRDRTGGMLLMSSLAGLIGMQLAAPYAATKAFTWNLAEGLNYELKPYHIDVMACISGATATPTYLKSKPNYGRIKPLVMQADKVAEAALNKLGKKALYIPGFGNRLNYFILTRLLPRKMAASLANKTMGEMYSKSD
jgi:short-subunit dehydrogenase